ncbi:unnamed protein product, partial [Allacma fusca]
PVLTIVRTPELQALLKRVFELLKTAIRIYYTVLKFSHAEEAAEEEKPPTPVPEDILVLQDLAIAQMKKAWLLTDVSKINN